MINKYRESSISDEFSSFLVLFFCNFDGIRSNTLFIFAHVSEALFTLFFTAVSLFFQMDNFYWSVFKFTLSLLASLWLESETLFQLFHFFSCKICLVYHTYFIYLLRFYFPLVQWCSFLFTEAFLNSGFEVFVRLSPTSQH